MTPLPKRRAEPFFRLIKAGVDVAPLLQQIDAQPDLWNQHDMRTTFPGTSHSKVDDIWVRYNAWDRLNRAELHGFNAEHIPVWYPAWEALPALRPIVLDLMAEVRGEMLGGVLITRVPAGSEILPHVDRGWHVEYYDKFYLSLRSDPGADFVCRHDGRTEAVCPAPGEVYLFDNRMTHWVTNESDGEKMTMIVCIRTEMFGRK